MRAFHLLATAGVTLLLSPLGVGRCAEQQPRAQDQARQILDVAQLGGGLIVHLGAGDGKLTASLGRSGRFLVHGVERDPRQAAAARRYISANGRYGRTSIWRLTEDRLPYVDNLVNLVVVTDQLGVPDREIQRVLAPLGVVVRRRGDRWEKSVKPWPDDIDEWTHFLHGPDNNAVAKDSVVGPPRHLQWLADPIHLRSHEHLNSVSAVVSAQGRIFYIIDEGATAAVTAPSQWRLVARDAFNGALLWKRDLGAWEGHFRLFRSGPPDIARRLVAVGNRVFATLGYGDKVAAFDAVTGKTIRTYDSTKGAVEILCDHGHLYVLLGEIDKDAWQQAARRFYPTPAPRHKSIVALDAESGRLLWRRADQETEAIMPATMAVADGRLFFQNTRRVVCLDANTGQDKWQADRPVYTTRLSWSTPTLVVRDGIVLSADGSTGGLPDDVRRGEDNVKWINSDQDIRKHPLGDVLAFSAGTGKRIWEGESLQGFCSPGDVFVIGDRVWSGAIVSPSTQKLDVALDLKTGQVASRSQARAPVGGHTRCYRNKATERFLVLGGIGVEFVDVRDWSWSSNPWVRGTCQYGVMPCNGMLYVPPDSCACRPNVRLHGFTALAPARDDQRDTPPKDEDPASRVEHGPAFGKLAAPEAHASKSSADEWPTYRHDNSRSGRTSVAVSAQVKRRWETKIGGRLSSLTVSSGKVFVSQIDAHTIHALDIRDGALAWSRTVGGPVDSPPTASQGRLVFGCRDGYVYCLRASDGELVWRFRAAPRQQLLVAQESIESAWPVNGSVLVRNGQVWFAAGRSSYLDGGLWLYAVQLGTGELVVARQLDGRQEKAWRTIMAGSFRQLRNRQPGTRPDILSASGDLLFMGWTCFDAQGQLVDDLEPHLFSATGFLDATWWHRTYWQYGTWMRGGFGGWPQAARRVPAGRVLVISDNTVFGFGREKYDAGNPEGTHAGHIGVIKNTYQDSGRVDYSQNPYRLFAAIKPGSSGRKGSPIQYRWTQTVPLLVRGMLLADKTLWIAGPDAGQRNEGLAKLNSVQPGRLWAVSAADGKPRAEYKLAAAPVLDGVVASSGRLFISCEDGTVCSYAGP